jgi:predicted neuraminidase
MDKTFQYDSLRIQEMNKCIRYTKTITNINGIDQYYFRKVAPESHTPYILYVPDTGNLFIVWFGGKAGSMSNMGIYISVLLKGSTQWQKPILLTCQQGYFYHNPVLFYHPDEKQIYLWFTYQRNKGSSLNDQLVYEMTTRDPSGYYDWSREKVLFKTNGTFIKGSPLLMKNNIVLPIYHKPPGHSKEAHYPALMIRERNGPTWTEIGIPNSLQCVQPYIIDAHDHYQLYYRDGDSKNIYQAYSYHIDKWENGCYKLDIPNNDSGICAIKVATDTVLLICNDTDNKKERMPLSIYVSTDNGYNFTKKMQLEPSPRIDKHVARLCKYSYPNVALDNDNNLHIVYSYNKEIIKYLSIGLDKILEM